MKTFTTLEELLYNTKYCFSCQTNCMKIRLTLGTTYATINGSNALLGMEKIYLTPNKINIETKSSTEDLINFCLYCSDNKCFFTPKDLQISLFESTIELNSKCEICGSCRDATKFNLNFKNNTISNFGILNDIIIFNTNNKKIKFHLDYTNNMIHGPGINSSKNSPFNKLLKIDLHDKNQFIKKYNMILTFT